jgi:sporulation protein YlmC with PRC-barrel domain
MISQRANHVLGLHQPQSRRKTMKKFVAAVTMLSVFGFFLTLGAFAQQAPGPGTTREPTTTRPATPGATPGTMTSPAMGEMYASKLIGANVKNQQGENVGKIDELVIDPQDARIKAAVVSVGGVLGLGAKSVAIPWNQLTMGTGADRDSVVVAMGKEELERAPSWQRTDR